MPPIAGAGYDASKPVLFIFHTGGAHYDSIIGLDARFDSLAAIVQAIQGRKPGYDFANSVYARRNAAYMRATAGDLDARKPVAASAAGTAVMEIASNVCGSLDAADNLDAGGSSSASVSGVRSACGGGSSRDAVVSSYGNAAGLGRAFTHLPSGGFCRGSWTVGGIDTILPVVLATSINTFIGRAVMATSADTRNLSRAISVAKELGASKSFIPILYSPEEGPRHWLGVVLSSSCGTTIATYFDPEGQSPVPEVMYALNAAAFPVSIASEPRQTCSDTCGESLIFGFANAVGVDIGSVDNAAHTLSNLLADSLTNGHKAPVVGRDKKLIEQANAEPANPTLYLDLIVSKFNSFVELVNQGREAFGELILKAQELLNEVLDRPQAGTKEAILITLLLDMVNVLNIQAPMPFFPGWGGGDPDDDPGYGGGSSGGDKKPDGGNQGFEAMIWS